MSSKNTIGKTKRSTDDMIDDAIAQQNDWLENRRWYARRFLKKLNIFARPKPQKQNVETKPARAVEDKKTRHNSGVLRSYWFPILCAILILLIVIWVLFIRTSTPQRVVIVPVVSDGVVQIISENDAPAFDIVRIERDGNIVVA